ncbi:MAG TPA: DUF3800 domain-containing protein [Candidatus Avamphibacillus sp.]|nr:DUF3800 domain-containing protein [Candidatus Avamphibacillus sp.]
MKYDIYFDESNKLDQPDGKYAYYGAFGADSVTIHQMESYLEELFMELNTKTEMHFVDYTSDEYFEKYFKALNYILSKNININLMLVNKRDAASIADQMGINLLELRELFYVKIPERLFYGMTRNLTEGNSVQIVIDKNSEYENVELEKKLKEQMNAHSAYRNKGYKVEEVLQVNSKVSIPIQVIDVLMGIIVFLIENNNLVKKHFDESISLMIKGDLIYRLLIHENNLRALHQVVRLFKWNADKEKITEINISEYTGNFILHKSQFDIQEMTRLEKLILNYPDKRTKFYREKMGYTNRQLRTLLGYLDELDGRGRNSYFYEESR